ncbi:DNA-binding transcriptional LysR family regulator [Skermanella aerolata]|uniref:LysR family transcriptional regulator n=1 Tax=Skermanella aerolata TaxID=393310 RepID=UPI003D19C3AB
MGEPFKDLAWDDFRLVKAIADAKGLPAAAARLGINHSTVFRRLRQIEAALGVALFERHRLGYVATAAGEEMVALADRLDEDITAFTRKVSGRELSPAGELRVTTNDTLLVHLLTPLFAAFLRQCPEMRLDVVLSNQPLNLSKRDADVAIRATDNPPETLVGRRAARIAWALYGRAADFPYPGAIPIERLFDRPWVALGEDLAAMKAVRFVREHVPPERIAYRTNTVLGLGEAVETGIGIGHLPCFIADARPGLVRLAEPDPELAADLWLLTHPDLRHAPRVRIFLDFLAAEIARQRRLIEGSLGGSSGLSLPSVISPEPSAG